VFCFCAGTLAPNDQSLSTNSRPGGIVCCQLGGALTICGLAFDSSEKPADRFPTYSLWRRALSAAKKLPLQPKTDRKTLILDAAEAEFSAHGYDAVTMRTIAARAGVDLALPNYYFTSKDNLFVEVFQRRAKELNAWRDEALTQAVARSAPQAPSVETIVRAYLEPLLKGPHLVDPGWKHYYALVAYVNNTPGWGGRLMAEHFDPLIRKFLDALRLALPGIDERNLFWGYHCFSGALTLALAQTGRIDRLSDGKVRSEDLADACEHMVPFITAGFKAAKAAPLNVATKATRKNVYRGRAKRRAVAAG
jgi:AcrR family transcriptional regulator